MNSYAGRCARALVLVLSGAVSSCGTADQHETPSPTKSQTSITTAGGLTLPSASCSFEQIAHKVAGNPLIGEDWDAASRVEQSTGSGDEWRSAGWRPTRELSFAAAEGTSGEAIAKKYGARVTETVDASQRIYVLEFPTTEAAIAAVKPMLCDPAVNWAAMTRVRSASDDPAKSSGRPPVSPTHRIQEP